MNKEINQKLASFIENDDSHSFSKECKPVVVGMLSNGDPVIYNKINEYSIISSHKQPLKLSNRILNKYDFNFCDLKYAQFNNTTCRDIDITNSILDFANFKGADLSQSRLIASSFVYASFIDAVLNSVDLSQSELVGSIFSKRIVTKLLNGNVEIDYQGIELQNLKAVESYFSKLEFRGCDFTKANLNKSTMKNILFENSILENTTFDRSTFNQVTIKDCNTIFNCSFESINGSSIYLKNQVFQYCNFSNSVFIGMKVNDTLFNNCTFTDCRFINVNFSDPGIKFAECDLTNSEFTNSTLSFASTNFDLCYFGNSKLTDCKIYIQDYFYPTHNLPQGLTLSNPNYQPISLLEESTNIMAKYS